MLSRLEIQEYHTFKDFKDLKADNLTDTLEFPEEPNKSIKENEGSV